MRKLAALLRAVNVGGTGKLPMADLRDMCAKLGFENPKTLLASGNVVFETDQQPDEAKKQLEAELSAYAGKPVGVFILTQEDVAKVLHQHPFPDHPPNQVGVLIADPLPSQDEIASAKGHLDEILELADIALYVKFPRGMGQSKLVVPASQRGTMRNINTIVKLNAALNA